MVAGVDEQLHAAQAFGTVSVNDPVEGDQQPAGAAGRVDAYRLDGQWTGRRRVSDKHRPGDKAVFRFVGRDVDDYLTANAVSAYDRTDDDVVRLRLRARR